jgi:hypothetical protein
LYLRLIMFSAGTWDTSWYLALDTIKQAIVVAFRGTTLSIADAACDWACGPNAPSTTGPLNFSIDYPDCLGCGVHGGYYNSTKDVRNDMINYVHYTIGNLSALGLHYDVYVVGHSEGAARAAFAALFLRKAGIVTTMINFGQPSIG